MKNIKTAIYLVLFTTSLCLPFSVLKLAAEEIPEPECITATLGEETACGYNCEESGDGDRVTCAEWPEGKCEASYSSVTCGPPAPDNWQDEYESSSDYDRIRDRDRDCDCDCDR